MKLLVTGNLGYVGPALTDYIATMLPRAEIIGFDAGFFRQPDNQPEAPNVTSQIKGDIRNVPPGIFEGVSSVVHLAAISNDPIGNEFQRITEEINWRSTVRLAQMAADAGVSSFVFASSCSVYGEYQGQPKKETDKPAPLSPYAMSKLRAEHGLADIHSDNMSITCLRFATACGWSSHMRLDLVLNDFVASAITSKEITVLSDGTPWRPIIDVADMARAMVWAIGRPSVAGQQMLCINAGSNDSNYQVKDLATAVSKIIPGTKVSIMGERQPDKRSYAVDFSLFKELAPAFQPVMTLTQSIERMRNELSQASIVADNFRASDEFIRLNQLRTHIEEGRLDRQLRWQVQYPT